MPGTPILDEDARLIAYLDTGIYMDGRLSGSGQRTAKPPGQKPSLLAYLFGR